MKFFKAQVFCSVLFYFFNDHLLALPPAYLSTVLAQPPCWFSPQRLF